VYLLSAENHAHNTYDNNRAREMLSTMKRIKTFLQSTMSEEHQSALAMLSVGKNLLQSSNFNEKVIEAFVLRKDGRMDFTYK
jgi:hypothetical protein